MLNVTEIAFCCYAVTDVPRARAFYEGVLGLKPAQVIDLPNGQWVEYEVGRALSPGLAHAQLVFDPLYLLPQQLQVAETHVPHVGGVRGQGLPVRRRRL